MSSKLKVSINIGFFVFFTGIIFLFISLYFYQDYSSIKVFLNEFFDRDINKFLLVGIFITSFIAFGFSNLILGNIFKNIEKYNKKLKDYNHYLAHELKTPISIINSNLEILEYDFDKNRIKNSKDELKNMTNIIDGLLKYSESFNDVDKKEINLENFIKKFITFKEYYSNVKIHNKEFNFTIKTDEILFERILKNLIENALKYSPNKFINIYIKQDKIIFKNDVYKTLGEEDLEKIFNKFYSRTCNENSGAGLGLPMIKEIVKVLGYELKVDSKDNKFIVEIILN